MIFYRHLILLGVFTAFIILAYLCLPVEVLPIPDLFTDTPMANYDDYYYEDHSAYHDPWNFAEEIKKLFQIISSSTISTAITTPQPLVTTAIPSMPRAVGAGVLAGARARALIVTVICAVLIIGSYCQLW